MHNDVSFLIANEINLYEQQSTNKPNMPLRMLQYSGNLYEKYLNENKINNYGRELLLLPVPRLVVFYNGEEEIAEESILELKDSFPKGSEADIEVRVRMLNVNYDKNAKLLNACKPLKEYAWLMQKIRENKKWMTIEDAVNRAIADMPGNFTIKSFLDAHKREVYGMLLTEYNEAEAMQMFERDGYRKGIVEGYNMLNSLVRKGLISEEDAARAAGISLPEFRSIIRKNDNSN